LTEPPLFRAAIVGLGQVGMLFDEDPRRRRVWTHFSAYERLERFELVAVCDVDPRRRHLAVARRPSVRAFATLEELLDAEPVDVVSLCTPIDCHAEQIGACARRVRAIVSEKPLSSDIESGRRAVEACAAASTLLAVNYYKRFEPAVEKGVRLMRDGAVGEIRAATALYSGPLDAVGSHAVDLLRFIVGDLTVVCGAGSRPGNSALFHFRTDRLAALICTGPREDLVFETDLLGEQGRLRILDNCERLELSLFEASARYDGYRELAAAPDRKAPRGEPFLSMFEEVADVLEGKRSALTSDGASALATQVVLSKMESHVACA
jgi:predicted dehydrogenase